MADFFSPIIDWYMSHINYITVMLLMTIESSFIPFPSEIVIPPAAWKAANGELNIFLVAASGTAGSILGALFNYYIAFFLGRKVIYSLADSKLAALFLIDRNSVKKAEDFFIKYGNISTFIGRLIFAVRQLISIPAGLSRMKMRPFLFYTAIGSGIWSAVLAALGYFLYSQKSLLDKYYDYFTVGFIIAGTLVIVFLVIRVIKKTREKNSRQRTIYKM